MTAVGTGPTDSPAGRGSANDQAGGQRVWSADSTVWMVRAQDIVSVAVGFTLVVLAAVILVAGIVDFFKNPSHLGLTLDATDLLDAILLVLILVEVVHTVVLSLRAHELSPEPFIVVGLVAAVRKILFTLGSQQHIAVALLGLYLGMVAVLVASLVAMRLLGRTGRAR
jgi:uncharacterized membrane protein (DUF373 family)